MASSRKPSRRATGGAAEALLEPVAAQLERTLRPGARVAAALSGGIDSVVLLDILHRLAPRLRLRLSALHVNHQLSPDAARWSAFCRRLCRVRGIPFRSVKVTIPRGDSVEAAARAARYEVFFSEPADYIALAHHQDDQVETLLLQLLRGAGVRGLAGMPVLRKAQGGRPKAILRPLLDVTRREIHAYAQARGLRWVDDASNVDLYFQRNFLRHRVLPAIAKRFPAYRVTIARAAGHLAEAALVLDEVARADGAAALTNGTLAAGILRELAPARARNLLRYFLAERGIRMPGAARLAEALRQIVTARHDAQLAIDLGPFQLRQFEGRLHVVPARTALPLDGYVRRWQGERELFLPELGGVLVMAPVRGGGLSLARLSERPVAVRARLGGERLQPDRRRPRRTLKNLMQEAGIPPWERERLPLLYCGADLVWVPALGIDCTYQAAPGERALAPSWHPARNEGTTGAISQSTASRSRRRLARVRREVP